MTLPTLATPDDVYVLLGHDADQNQVEALLRKASALVRAEARCTWVDEDGALVDPLPDGIPEVTAGIVERALRNPTGVTQEQTGPWMQSFGANAANRIYLTQPDRDIIAAASCRLAAGLWTLGTTRGPIETPSVRDPWCDDEAWLI